MQTMVKNTYTGLLTMNQSDDLVSEHLTASRTFVILACRRALLRIFINSQSSSILEVFKDNLDKLLVWMKLIFLESVQQLNKGQGDEIIKALKNVITKIL